MRKLFLLFCLFCATEASSRPFNRPDTATIHRLLKEAAECQRTHQKKSLQLSEKALQLSSQHKYTAGIAKAKINIGSIIYTNGATDTAKEIILEALHLFVKTGDDKGAAGAELLLSYIYQDLGMTDSAFASIYKALKHNNKANNPERLLQIHINLGNLHLNYGDKKQAYESFLLAEKMASSTGNEDGSISAWDGLGRYFIETGQYHKSLIYFNRIDSVSASSGDLYSVAQNLNNIALCYEYLTDFLLAKATYKKALKMYEQLKMTGDMALAYYNIGNVFLMTSQTDSAIANLLAAVQYGRMANDLTRVARSYKLLATAYSKKGDYARAYRYEQAQSNLNDSLLNKEKVTQIAAMQTRYNTETKRQRIALLEAQNKTKDAQRNIFIVGSILLLLLALAIGIGLIRTRKQKAISESLLLNILPAEVADELKQKGSADAQYFDQVTVLFTDFKNFTQITEKMSPSELVNLLHDCFRTFDLIITRHHVEKIKTIGDSYMCAGGLPVPNKSYPEDVVLAALEIQEYMADLKKRRLAEGKQPIEMRVGIHTGPVVAGIVGVKKFAYDIWGDTVNTASRMESSGAEGKVNVSASTYELIKDKFICTPRGKINAKHKGELEMYYVESPKTA